ncbi:NYN domain-containing protein [Pseudogracilibacillus sp. SO30301A]|uniref:NYN domain-containing protein n=1 Tax=Pseudogracilibacillus sp. SO30301A TaxID=3098291 RepID=UPI00300E26C4
MDVLVVDGYNIIGAWDELNKLKLKDMALARSRLIELLVEYKAYTGNRVIIVFDALYVKGNESKKSINGVEIIYTRENETADECIERLVKSLKNVKNQVYVATSDYLEQRTIFGRGALRISARELLMELKDMEASISDELEQQTKEQPKIKIHMKGNVREKLEKWRRGNL